MTTPPTELFCAQKDQHTHPISKQEHRPSRLWLGRRCTQRGGVAVPPPTPRKVLHDGTRVTCTSHGRGVGHGAKGTPCCGDSTYTGHGSMEGCSTPQTSARYGFVCLVHVHFSHVQVLLTVPHKKHHTKSTTRKAPHEKYHTKSAHQCAMHKHPSPANTTGMPPTWARHPDPQQAQQALHKALSAIYGEREPDDYPKECTTWRRKFLWFTDQPRPAYYGSHSAPRTVCGPRAFHRREPEIEYEVESDEDWCEEPEGENLEVRCGGGCGCGGGCMQHELVSTLISAPVYKIICTLMYTQDDDERDEGPDGEEEEDSFVVEDGYLSENEGVQPDEDVVEMSGMTVACCLGIHLLPCAHLHMHTPMCRR